MRLCRTHSAPSLTPTFGPYMAKGAYMPSGLINFFRSATMNLIASGSQVTILLVCGMYETMEIKSEL